MRALGLAAACVLGLAGCLEPGDPIYPRADTEPPRVEVTDPVAGAVIPVDGALRITFSEQMDERALRPGIAVFAGREEVALRLEVPLLLDSDGTVERGDEPYTVTARAESGALDPGTAYTLVLRTSLTDTQGNGLVDEVRVPFTTGP
ncbi:Ig-like domain-containing protein [Myxococcaceae bacterium GXIMD 01537]